MSAAETSPLTVYAKSQRRTARHESAHAIIDHILGVQVCRVTIVPLPGSYKGCCDTSFPPQHKVTPAQWDLHQRRSILSLLAGPLAIWEQDGDARPLDMGGWNDIQKILEIALRLYPEASKERRSFFLGDMAVISRTLITDPAMEAALTATAAALLHWKTLTPLMLAAVLAEALPDADRVRLRRHAFGKIRVLSAVMSASHPENESETL